MAEKHGLSDYSSGYAQGGYENGPFKRQKVEMGGYGGSQGGGYRQSSSSDPHFAEPSPVIHVRGVANDAREQDLLHLLSPYGQISCITMMPKIRQALVEFTDIASANTLIEATQAGQSFMLNGRPVLFNYSKSKTISRNTTIQHEAPPNKVILVTIINPQYPISTDILHTIFSKQGNVQRIVVFRRSGLQAMVEFDCIEAATNAKNTLNGADIYTGCNTLKIEFSKAQKLNVYKNDDETFDYTEDKGPPMYPKKSGLLTSPPPDYRGGYGGPGPGPMMGPRTQMHAPPPVAGGTVLMVYGLHADKMNCDRLFNMLCCYGNVLRIKFLLNKPGTAMAEMSDHVACNTVIHCLTGVTLFGNKLDFGYSKQKYLLDSSMVPSLPDGTPSYKSFMDSKNQRFWTPEQSNKNRIFSPTKVLHFFNSPPDITEEKFKEICEECEVEAPTIVNVFPNPTRNSSGLLEWSSTDQALEALAACNHYVLRNPEARTIFTIKLAFSSMPSAKSA